MCLLQEQVVSGDKKSEFKAEAASQINRAVIVLSVRKGEVKLVMFTCSKVTVFFFGFIYIYIFFSSLAVLLKTDMRETEQLLKASGLSNP